MIAHIRLLFWIGLGLVFLPNLGIPNTMKHIIAVLVGIAIIALSLGLRRHYKILKFKLRRAEQSVSEQETIIHE
jgi:hypothetical protein